MGCSQVKSVERHAGAVKYFNGRYIDNGFYGLLPFRLQSVRIFFRLETGRLIFDFIYLGDHQFEIVHFMFIRQVEGNQL